MPAPAGIRRNDVWVNLRGIRNFPTTPCVYAGDVIKRPEAGGNVNAHPATDEPALSDKNNQ